MLKKQNQNLFYLVDVEIIVLPQQQKMYISYRNYREKMSLTKKRKQTTKKEENFQKSPDFLDLALNEFDVRNYKI